jgi:DNA-binding LytR/AlgR family response regulator
VHLGASLCAVLLKYLIYVPLRSLIEANYQVGVIEAISADFLGKLMFFWAAIGMLHAIFFYRRYQAHSGVAAELASPLNHAKQASRADGISACADNVFPFVANAQIEWIEAQGNYVLIHAGERRHLVRETMVAVSAKLDPSRFVRVHRSAIVNVAAVSYVEPAAKGRYRLTLRNGESLSTGRSFRARARGLLR